MASAPMNDDRPCFIVSYSVMQLDWNSSYGDVVLGSFNMAH